MRIFSPESDEDIGTARIGRQVLLTGKGLVEVVGVFEVASQYWTTVF